MLHQQLLVWRPYYYAIQPSGLDRNLHSPRIVGSEVLPPEDNKEWTRPATSTAASRHELEEVKANWDYSKHMPRFRIYEIQHGQRKLAKVVDWSIPKQDRVATVVKHAISRYSVAQFSE